MVEGRGGVEHVGRAGSQSIIFCVSKHFTTGPAFSQSKGLSSQTQDFLLPESIC